jgi:K+-sensing histidine kinase KdpD
MPAKLKRTEHQNNFTSFHSKGFLISLSYLVKTLLAHPLLVKVFAYLLDNSLRYGQRVTEIRFSTYNEGDDLVVVWDDNGVGIAPGGRKKFSRSRSR